MNPNPFPRPFEALGDNDRILFLDHDVTVPYCFDVSDASDVDDANALAEA